MVSFYKSTYYISKWRQNVVLYVYEQVGLEADIENLPQKDSL